MRISDWSSDVCSSDLHTLTLVVNQAAGGLLDGSITPEDIAERLGDAGFEVDLLSGSPAGIRERLERAVEMPSNVIVVAGGDGTINTAAQVLAGRGTTPAVIPAGTLNHLTRDLGIPGDFAGTIQVLRTGEATSIEGGGGQGRREGGG